MKPQVYYQLNHDYGEYSHSEILCESLDYEVVKTDYLFAIEQTLAETDSTTDCLEIEKLLVTLDENGEVYENIDYLESMDSHTFKPLPE